MRKAVAQNCEVMHRMIVLEVKFLSIDKRCQTTATTGETTDNHTSRGGQTICGRARGIPLPSPSPLLLPPPRLSLVQQLVVVLMPPPLILSTVPPPLNVQPRPIEAPLPLVHGASPLVCLSFAGWL